MTQTPQRPHWQDYLSALASGVVGDWLAERGNPLAVSMALLQHGKPLTLTRAQLQASYPQAGQSVTLFVHGLTELESIWDYPKQPGINYGSLLQQELGITPLFLRYNTGLPIAANGRQLSALISQLIAAWPVPITRLDLIGHSMGGLVIRSACHQGALDNATWIQPVQRCIYIGSPHLGAPLARAAHHTASLLRKLPRDYLRAAGDVIDVRSQGIRDLQHGQIHDEQETLPPLLASARHYAISGNLSRNPGHPVNRMFGDALVHTHSALGKTPGWNMTEEAEFHGIGHMALTHHADVYLTLRRWCQ